jgi:hypothetical protein
MSNVQALSWSNTDQLSQWIKNQGFKSGLAILLVELVVDWFKFSFVTKFNRFEGKIFSVFKTNLCNDLLRFRSRSSENEKNSEMSSNRIFHYLDSTHIVSKRLGFVSLPLCCTFMHSMIQSIKGIKDPFYYLAIKIIFIWILSFLGKVLLSITLFGHSAKVIIKKTK